LREKGRRWTENDMETETREEDTDKTKIYRHTDRQADRETKNLGDESEDNSWSICIIMKFLPRTWIS
jgi:hypothetical protein